MDTPSPYFSKRKPARCPACGSARVASILYGMPGADVQEAVAQGRVVLGGCCVSNCDPTWRCLDCDASVYPEGFRELSSDTPPAF